MSGRWKGHARASIPQASPRTCPRSTFKNIYAYRGRNFPLINKEVRETVVFAQQALLTDPPFSKLDLIICRNLMIYLEPDAQEKCMTLFHYALKAGGFSSSATRKPWEKKQALLIYRPQTVSDLPEN